MEDDSLARAAGYGIDLAGASVGGLAGFFAGGPVGALAGAFVGTSITAVGREITSRLLSRRQQTRVGALLIQAGAAIQAIERAGGSIRDDDFWRSERSDGEEFAEGVMEVAMDTFEERKLPYLANLLAHTATDIGIDTWYANRALMMAERMSWVDLCLLSVVAQKDTHPLPDEPFWLNGSRPNVALNRTWVDLFKADLFWDDEGNKPDYATNSGVVENLNKVELTGEGRWLVKTLGLQTIPPEDLAAVRRAMQNPTYSSQGKYPKVADVLPQW